MYCLVLFARDDLYSTCSEVWLSTILVNVIDYKGKRSVILTKNKKYFILPDGINHRPIIYCFGKFKLLPIRIPLSIYLYRMKYYLVQLNPNYDSDFFFIYQKNCACKWVSLSGSLLVYDTEWAVLNWYGAYRVC